MKDSPKRIEELQNILESTKLLNASRDLDFILKELMNSTLKLITRADIGIIFLYDKETNLLHSKCSFGFGDMKISLKPGESITGITFTSKKTLHLDSPEKVLEVMGSMSPSNRKVLDRSITRTPSELLSSISCPLMHEDECIGVLVIDNYIGNSPLTPDDVYLAELISVQATIAIKNADNYLHQKRTQEDLRKYSKLVEMEKNKYKYSTLIHNKFTEMILNRNNAKDIIKEVSDLLKTDVFLIDHFYSITSYAGEFHKKMEELDMARSSILKYLNHKKETIHFSSELGIWMILYPIFISEEAFGWVGAILSSKDIDELDQIVIEKCSNVVALEILKDYDMENLEQSIRGDFFDSMLKGDYPDLDNRFYKKYKIDFSHHHRIIMIHLHFEMENSPVYKYLRYFYQTVNSLALEMFSGSLSVQRKNYIVVIVDDENGLDRSKICDFHSKLEDTSQKINDRTSMNTSCVSLVSERIRNYDELREVYERTSKLFQIIPENIMKGCQFYEDHKVKKILMKNEKKDLESFVSRTLSPILNYSNSSKSELFHTLKTYMYNGGNWTKTKNDMHIHGNTLTYRLTRLKELLGADLDDYQTRLRIQLALEIMEIYPEFEKQI